MDQRGRREGKRDARHEGREERYHRRDETRFGDYYSVDRKGDQYGGGGYAVQGHGSQPPYGSGVPQTAGGGYNPGFISQDPNFRSDYINDDNVSDNRRNAPYTTQVHSYGAGGTYVPRHHDSTNDMYSSAHAQISYPTSAPFGTPGSDSGRGSTAYRSPHSPHTGYEGDSNVRYGGHPSGGPGHRGDAQYGGPNSPYGGSGYEEKGFGHVAPQVYNSDQGHRSKGNNYGGTPQVPLGPGSPTGGYAPGGPRRESVGPGAGHAGRDPNYDMAQPFGSPHHGDDRGKYSAQSSSYSAPQPYDLYSVPRRNEDGKDYPGLNPRDTPGLGTTVPVSYGAPPWGGTHYSAEDRDQYTGNKYKN